MKFFTNKKYFSYLLSLGMHFAIALLVLVKYQNPSYNSEQSFEFILDSSDNLNTEISKKILHSVASKSKFIEKIDRKINEINDISENHSKAENESKITSLNNEVLNTSNTNIAKTNTVISPEQKYILLVRETIEKNKKYPALAKKMGHTGLVSIRFVINKNGTVISKNIDVPSKFDSLNMASLKLLEKINKFEEFPESLRKENWTFSLPIEYKL